jgi:hypothetical protein
VAARSKAWAVGRALAGIVGSNGPIPVAARSKAWAVGRALAGIVGSNWPIPVAARSKAWAVGRALAGIVGSNTKGGMVFITWECCVLSGRGLYIRPITRPEESYRVWCA